MYEAISDTGPILHLSEIDKLSSLNIFEQIYIPTLVAAELEHFDLKPNRLNIDTPISTVAVDRQQRQNLLQSITQPPKYLVKINFIFYASTSLSMTVTLGGVEE